MDLTPGHVPVMLAEVLEHLKPRPGQTVLDGTAGGGGHAAVLLERIRPGGTLLLLDRDQETLERLIARFGRLGDVRYFHANFRDFDQVLAETGQERLHAALLDLGLSSLQLDEADRGFSFDRPGPLDMRFDRSQDLSAEEIVNRWPAARMADLFRDYGDQPFAGRIANAIVAARRLARLRRTDELAAIVTAAQPAAYRRELRIHPATRVFQALRMAVNEEVKSLEEFLDKIFRFLRPGGRVAIISFHSGEDRVVKTRFRDAVGQGLATLPFVKPLTATPEEIAANPRSRSARLRVAERTILNS